MKGTVVSALITAFTLTIAQPAVAQDVGTSIVGTWKIMSQVRKEIVSGATANIFGQKPIGHLMYTKGGHVLWFFVSDNRKAPASANLTDAERVELFRTLAAGSGTYKVEGKKIIARHDASWHQLWTGTDIANDAEISGNTLTLTTAPFKSPQDGKDVVVVTTWERIE
jgi:hypothetical protein